MSHYIVRERKGIYLFLVDARKVKARMWSRHLFDALAIEHLESAQMRARQYRARVVGKSYAQFLNQQNIQDEIRKADEAVHR